MQRCACLPLDERGAHEFLERQAGWTHSLISEKVFNVVEVRLFGLGATVRRKIVQICSKSLVGESGMGAGSLKALWGGASHA
jgi:hypothetical protein